jgi:hypothetical protein
MPMVLLPGLKILLILAKFPEGFETPSGAAELHEVAFVDE